MGKVIVSGGCRAYLGVKAADLPVGTVVKLMENDVPTDFLVVHQGLPSNIYDDSCNGTWLLRKDIKENRLWNNSPTPNSYNISSISTWLNNEYFNSFGTIEQLNIAQCKIPYCKGNKSTIVYSGAEGFSNRIFLLGSYEIGWDVIPNISFPQDGIKLSYFESGTGTEANNKRVAKLSNVASFWFTRTALTSNNYQVMMVLDSGDPSGADIKTSRGIRPALILPSTARFDKNTLLLKG